MAKEKTKKAASSSGSGLDENIAGALSYVLGFITGIIFLVIDKDKKFVKFHAIQSIALSVVWVILWVILGIISVVLMFIPVIGWILNFFIWVILGLGGLILWLLLMYKAYNNEKWKLPIIGNIAEQQASK